VADLQPSRNAPVVILGTAHPAKFPDAVERASGTRPQLPAWLAGMMEKSEKFDVLPSDAKMVEEYVSNRARAAA
jgi:threonine synthase